jgi:OmpA-OmpF porin, OOP family
MKAATIFFVMAVLGAGRYTQAQMLNKTAFELVNSAYDEQGPVISPDGKTLYFTIGNHERNVGGKKDPGDIWVSLWVGGQWSAPVHGGPVLNSRGYNAVAGLSGDGSQLFLHGHYDATGATARTQGISVSRSTGGGWSQPENIHIPYFQNKSTQVGGYVSPDKGIFVFSADTYGSRGVEDIYVCFNEDGRWTEPKNLGSSINTQFQELSPSLSADGKTVYFSSNGRRGNGSFDVYFAERLDDTWMRWSEPTNMGALVNSEGRELYYRTLPEQGMALFTTTKNSDGYGDIKMISPKDPPVKPEVPPVVKVDSTVQRVAITRNTVTADDKQVTVFGKVNNAKTGEPIGASLVFSSPAFGKSVSSVPQTGFQVLVPSVNVYTIRIEAKGFISVFEKLDIQTYEMKELEMTFNLQPVEVGTTVNLKNVLFERGTANLLPESNDELDLVVSFLQTNPKVVIDLSGHTDNRGVHSHNVRLSQQRVNKVKDYLVSKGIAGKRIVGKGYGGTKPIASNETEESRMLNRRVEFTIKKF